MARGLRLAALLLRESGRLRLVPGVLVAYLACRGDRVSREALAGRFWPERAGKVVGNVTSCTGGSDPVRRTEQIQLAFLGGHSALFLSYGDGVGPAYGPECAE